MNTALAEAAQARVDEALPVQEELHELLGFPASVAGELLDARRAQAVRRGGRPPGARNKRLAEIAQHVRENFGDVLLQQVAIATMPVADLVALGLKPLEALQEKRLSAATVLPYIEQKRPIAVDVTGRQVVHLSIEIGADQGEQNQEVIDAVVVQLDSTTFDNRANPLIPLSDVSGAQLIEDQAGAPPPPPPPGLAGATPPGGGFAAVALSHAPATVVSPEGEVFDPTRNPDPADPGAGDGAMGSAA